MGVFDWLLGNTNLGENGKENGVDVEYTGGDVRHLNEDSKYGYDGKMVSGKSGSTHIYETNDGWESHSHKVVDKNGAVVYSRDNSEDSINHPWEDRKHMLELLKNMSLENLLSIKEYFDSYRNFESDNFSKKM